MPDPLVFSEDDFTIGDLEDFEEITGSPLTDFLDLMKANGSGEMRLDAKAVKIIKAIVFIVKRRENPDFTLEDARRVKFSELAFVPSGVDPTPAAG